MHEAADSTSPGRASRKAKQVEKAPRPSRRPRLVKLVGKTGNLRDMQVAHAPRRSGRAKLVKLADKISNLLDIVGRPPAK